MTDAEQNPTVRVELIDEMRVVERQHDLVVLSTGMLPGADIRGIVRRAGSR